MRVLQNYLISYSSVSAEEGVQFCFKDGMDKSVENKNSLNPDVNVGNFIIVIVQVKNSEVEFVAQIIEIDKETDNVHVFLTLSGGLKTFKYNYKDVAWVHMSEIKQMLPTPTLNNQSVTFDNDIALKI